MNAGQLVVAPPLWPPQKHQFLQGRVEQGLDAGGRLPMPKLSVRLPKPVVHLHPKRKVFSCTIGGPKRSEICKARYNISIIDEAQQRLNIFTSAWCLPSQKCFYFIRVHGGAIRRKAVTPDIKSLLLKFTVLKSGKKVIFPEAL